MTEQDMHDLYIEYRSFWQGKRIENPGTISPKEVTIKQLFENIYMSGYRVGRRDGFSEGHAYQVPEEND